MVWYRADGGSLLHRLYRVRCPQPWPRPTTALSRRRSSGDGVRSALCHIAPGSSDPGSRLLHKPARRSLRRAVWRAPRESLPTASLLVAASESRQHGSTAHSTAGSSAMAACSPSSPSSQPACPPSCTAPCGAHIPRDTNPTDVAAACRCARTRTSSCRRPRWRGSRMCMWTPRPLLPAALPWTLNAVQRTLCRTPCISHGPPRSLVSCRLQTPDPHLASPSNAHLLPLPPGPALLVL
mmetsp:Transcript_43717/g.92990  ORF Transcript_43717/g.92990 Transcript_43717/m.92990 type:complete len:238 (+) Transcript_43717:142-855(+)